MEKLQTNTFILTISSLCHHCDISGAHMELCRNVKHCVLHRLSDLCSRPTLFSNISIVLVFGEWRARRCVTSGKHVMKENNKKSTTRITTVTEMLLFATVCSDKRSIHKTPHIPNETNQAQSSPIEQTKKEDEEGKRKK